MESSLQGTRIGSYEVGRLVGAGAMATVYEAVRTSDGGRVALKLLNPELAANPVARARFLGEAELSARVRDPHVVDVLDAGQADDHVYLAMELLEGEDLARRIQRDGPLAIRDAADILMRVCEAVATAHQQGITHRDLKPSNIFLAVKDGQTRPVLLDFGIARQKADAAAPAERTVEARAGTPMYWAPELVADSRAASAASDQYALGAILYQSLTGVAPYAGDDLDQLLRSIAAGEAPTAHERRPEVPSDLDGIVRRAMSRDPRERFPSVSGLAQALRPFAQQPAAIPEAVPRRAPSSPAIQGEAAVPSPFSRTLSPDAPADSAPWFAAHEAPADVWPEPTRALPELAVSKAGLTEPEPDLAVPAKFPALWRALARDRRRIAIVSALVLGSLGLMTAFRRKPASPPPPPAASQPAPPPVTAVVVSPPPAPPPPPVPTPPPPPEPPAAAAPKPTAGAPTPEPPAAEPAPEVKHAAKARPRPTAPEVRMHNGVPLLD